LTRRLTGWRRPRSRWEKFALGQCGGRALTLLLLLLFVVFLFNPEPIVTANFNQYTNASAAVVLNPPCACLSLAFAFRCAKVMTARHINKFLIRLVAIHSIYSQTVGFTFPSPNQSPAVCCMILPHSSSASFMKAFFINALTSVLVPIVCNLLHYRMESDHGSSASLQVWSQFLPLVNPRMHAYIHTYIRSCLA
jgi:hypothetical protein